MKKLIILILLSLLFTSCITINVYEKKEPKVIEQDTTIQYNIGFNVSQLCLVADYEATQYQFNDNF